MNPYSVLDETDETPPSFDEVKKDALSQDWASVPVAALDMSSPRKSQVEIEEDDDGWVSTRKKKKGKDKEPFTFTVPGKDGYKCYGYRAPRGTPGSRYHQGVWFVPHRIGAPAYEYTDGSYKYYKYGKVDREGGPAIFWSRTGESKYFRQGKLIETEEKDAGTV